MGERVLLFQDSFWLSPGTFLELIQRDLEKGHITIDEILSKRANVKVYLQEGKLRAYCESCKSETCTHTYFAMDHAIRKIVRRVLEVERVDNQKVYRDYRKLKYRDKRKILRSIGIDVDDLQRYINQIKELNAKDLQMWEGITGPYYAFLF